MDLSNKVTNYYVQYKIRCDMFMFFYVLRGKRWP